MFPLLIAVLYFREAAGDLRMVLAWLCFLWGAVFAYFFAFGPPLTMDGDFLWGARIGLLVLFCVSTLFLLERIRAVRWKALVASAAWFAHVIYGVSYYWHYFTTQKYI